MSGEPSRDELLDNTPEAVAMRRAREKRAEAARARETEAATPPRRGRRWAVGAVLAALMGARLFERIVNGRAR